MQAVSDVRTSIRIGPRAVRRPRVLALAVSVLLTAVSCGLLTFTAPAAADTVPPDDGTPATVSSDALPTVQIDGVVWSQAVVGDRVYVGGNFATARPAGAEPGTDTVTRTHLLAYNIKTGELIDSFAPELNGQVRSIAASPDGKRIYAAGDFTSVDGTNRPRIAAFDAATGALITSFTVAPNGPVLGIAATNTKVYFGGWFSAVGSDTRAGAAAVQASDGAVLPWAPERAGGDVRQLVVSPDGSKVVLGGSFTSLNGSDDPGYGLGAVDATSAELLPFNANGLIRNGGSQAAIYSLAGDEDGVYGTGYVFGSGGNLEGAFRASWDDGELTWVEDCHGDSYSAAPIGDTVYVAGHSHYCGTIEGGFPQAEPWGFHRGLAFTKAKTGTVKANEHGGYFNFEGNPAPTLLDWFPDMNVGTATGMSQGPWHVTGNDDYVVYGGEFTAVNGKGQQGLVRFATKDVAPNKDGPRVTGDNMKPKVVSPATGTARITWPANWDRDNEELTYRLLRDGKKIFETTERSTFWNRPTISYLDEGLTPGDTHTYQIRALDPFDNSRTGSETTVEISGGVEMNGYDQTILADGAQHYWPLNEATGNAAEDWSSDNDAPRRSGVTAGVAGVGEDMGTAYHFDGSQNGYLASTAAEPGRDTFSAEAWFKTTTNRGGKIIGFGSSADGLSPNYDRHVYLRNDGKINFGVYRGQTNVISSPEAYNDGEWHHVVASLSPAGMGLSVDGASVAGNPDISSGQVYNGHWRIGGDNLAGWPHAPSSNFLTGDVARVATYPGVLSAKQVSDHHTIGLAGTPNAAPEAAFDAEVSDLSVSVDASDSTDDGSIASYAWEFGDGDTGAGETASHTYAEAGTYDVTLTVTDDEGEQGSVTQDVTVNEPPAAGVVAADDFERNRAAGLGAAQAGGNWELNTAESSFSVADGQGIFTTSSAGKTRAAHLSNVQAESVDITTTAVGETPATGGGTYVSVAGRKVAANAEYRAKAHIKSTGKVALYLTALKGSAAEENLGSAVAMPGSLPDQTGLNIRLQVTGTSPTTIRAKVWPLGTTEPQEWMRTSTDSYAGLQEPGTVGLLIYVSSSATNTPTSVAFDDFAAKVVEVAAP